MPDEVKNDMEIFYVTKMDDVLPLVLTGPLPIIAPPPSPISPAESRPSTN